MKKLLISFLLLQFLSGSAIAEDILSIPYKNIKEKAKLTYQDGIWSTKVSRKNPEYFIKFISVGTGNYSEFYKSSGAFAFTSGCQYEFIHDGKLIGYSNHDLKFYEIISENGYFINREMAPEEIQELFPDFKIIKITDFSPNTNSLKIKKESRNFKVIILKSVLLDSK